MPLALGKVFVLPPPARLHDTDPVPLLRGTERATLPPNPDPMITTSSSKLAIRAPLPWSTYSLVLLFTWRVIPENDRRVIGIRIGDQDTCAAREVDRVSAGGLVGSEHAGDPCCRQQRPGELCVRPPVEPANFDHVPARFG
jgi:hypothetical protein